MEDLPVGERTNPAGTEFRDLRSGVYDAVNDAGRPAPDQVREALNPHQAAQEGADVRGDPEPSEEATLPEGLRRSRKGPYSPKIGRRSI